MEGDPDRDLIAAITLDVMKCLDRSGFFGKLDDCLCPKEASYSREVCCGTYKLSESILRTCGFDSSEFDDTSMCSNHREDVVTARFCTTWRNQADWNPSIALRRVGSRSAQSTRRTLLPT